MKIQEIETSKGKRWFAEYIGKVAVPQPVPDSACSLLLPYGSFNKPKLMDMYLIGNACYSYRIFRGSFGYLRVYEYQFSEAEKNIQIARIIKWDKIGQNNFDLSKLLRSIISTVTAEVAR